MLRYLLIQSAWIVAQENTIYSASTVESTTVSYFLLSYDISPSATKKIFSLVDCHESLHLAKSELI